MPSTLFDTPEPRSVMTYNLKNGNNRAHWLLRRRKLVRVIRSEHPTLLGTQEGYRDQLDYIRKELSGYSYLGAGRDADGSNEFNAIFYDTRIVTPLDSGTWWLADTPDKPGSIIEGENFPRIATWGRFTIAGHDRDIVMVNTHLTYQDIGLHAQVGALIDGIDHVAGPDTDVILTGDFNQPRFTPAWQRIVDAGFVDAMAFAGYIEGPVFTFAGWGRWPHARALSIEKERRIDWILYRPGPGQDLPHDVTLRTVNTHTTPNPPSDHFPVVLGNQRPEASE